MTLELFLWTTFPLSISLYIFFNKPANKKFSFYSNKIVSHIFQMPFLHWNAYCFFSPYLLFNNSSFIFYDIVNQYITKLTHLVLFSLFNSSLVYLDFYWKLFFGVGHCNTSSFTKKRKDFCIVAAVNIFVKTNHWWKK